MVIPIMVPMPTSGFDGPLPDRPSRGLTVAGVVAMGLYGAAPWTGGFFAVTVPGLLGLTLDGWEVGLVVSSFAFLFGLVAVASLVTAHIAGGVAWWRWVLVALAVVLMVFWAPTVMAASSQLSGCVDQLSSSSYENYLPAFNETIVAADARESFVCAAVRGE